MYGVAAKDFFKIAGASQVIQVVSREQFHDQISNKKGRKRN